MCPLATPHRVWLSGRAHPHTAAPLCRPWLPAAVLGPGGCGCRQLSFWQLLWLPRTSPWEASPSAMCLGAGFRSRTGWSGPQHPKLQGGQSGDPPPALASLPSPLPQLCPHLCQAFCSCRGCIPRWALVPPRHWAGPGRQLGGPARGSGFFLLSPGAQLPSLPPTLPHLEEDTWAWPHLQQGPLVPL